MDLYVFLLKKLQYQALSGVRIANPIMAIQSICLDCSILKLKFMVLLHAYQHTKLR